MCGATTLDEAVKIFESQEIVWVHKEEDEKLPKTKRPNPDEEYAKAGIEIIKTQILLDIYSDNYFRCRSDKPPTANCCIY